MRFGTSIVALAATLFSAHAFADPIKSSEEIVKFFAGEATLGAKRGICVGTEDECRSKAEAAPAPSGLDMLVNFDLDSASLGPDAQAKLTEFAKALKDSRLHSLSFAVEGYTDASGSASYNQGLSQRRAQSVTAFLLERGVEASRLSAVGLGKNNPRTANPYDPVNRRVEMRIMAQ